MKAGPYLQYLQDEVAPRWPRILGRPGPWLAALLTVAAVHWPGSFLAQVKAGDLAVIVLTYSAIAFGFCLAGLTITMTVPATSFLRKLAASTSGEQDALSDLFFVFSWTAVMHWVAMLSAIVLLAGGSERAVFPPGASVRHTAAVGLTVFLMAYALMQFLVTLITLSQVARIYVAHVKSDAE